MHHLDYVYLVVFHIHVIVFWFNIEAHRILQVTSRELVIQKYQCFDGFFHSIDLELIVQELVSIGVPLLPSEHLDLSQSEVSNQVVVIIDLAICQLHSFPPGAEEALKFFNIKSWAKGGIMVHYQMIVSSYLNIQFQKIGSIRIC
mmetsp:Transcript_7913/g.7418  ORF Transcript_7913/g.7418 Transcript_7913/m.7418 type:complete len:145 (+) Transcript_7913:84-518(+)